MAALITVDDLLVFETGLDPAQAQAMIDDATALALQVAPCLETATDPKVLAAAKAILRGAILRWHKSDGGAVTQRQQTAGSFMLGESMDTRQNRKGMFWPSEITDLARLCGDSSLSGRAFEVDTMPAGAGANGKWIHPDTWVPLP